MPLRGLQLAVALFALLVSAQAAAATPDSARESAVEDYLAVVDPGLDIWRSEWDFYGWWPAFMDGESTVDGVTVPLDNGLDNKFNLRNWGVGTRLESWMGPWGVIVDVGYTRFDSDVGKEPQQTVGRIDQFVADLGLGFRLNESGGKQPFTVDVIAIFRYAILKQSVYSPPRTDWVEGKQNYAEFAVGLQFRKKISERWWLWARGDIGGFGWSQSSQLTYNVFLGASFELTADGGSMIKFGWRLYDIDYELREDPGAFAWNATVHGPFVSYTWVF